MEQNALYEGQPLYHPKGWWGRDVFSQDHKVIALQYIFVALAIGLTGMFLSLIMRMQLGFPGLFESIDAGSYYQDVTMHGMIMVIYLLTALFLGGFGNYLIPLMLGSRDMAFPFVNMLSFWVYFLSVIILVCSFFVESGPTGAGWTLYPPQSILEGTPGADGAGILLMLGSLAVFIIAFTMGGLNYITTVLQSRAKGMNMMRMPLIIWCLFLATFLGLLAFPALLVGAIMLIFDRVLESSFFMPEIFKGGEVLDYGGGSPVLFQHLFWFFGHPEVYIIALPAFGIISELISCHARKNIFGYNMMVWALIAIAGIAFIVWAHHMYVAGMNPYLGFFFATTTLIIAVPTAIKVYNWVITLWNANIKMTVPMLYCLAFLITFLIGGLTGLFLGNVAVDVPLSDTYFVVGHFHMVMAVSPVLALYGGLYHWFPSVTGRMLDDRLGKIHFWITFVGTYLIYFPMHYIGFLGVPRRYYSNEQYDFIPQSVNDLNQFITVCALIVGASQFILLYNFVVSAVRGKKAGSNPWGACTLEWQALESPPGHGNWGDKLPVVYRWPYDYGLPGATADFVPQNVPDEQIT